uniref:hypothetical protein n=1 Tax=uncultured Psychrobacter sp. TaxID=259303 RepID=UPI00260F308D
VGHRQLSIPESPLNLIVEGLFFVQRLRFIGCSRSFIHCRVSIKPIIRSFVLKEAGSIYHYSIYTELDGLAF